MATQTQRNQFALIVILFCTLFCRTQSIGSTSSDAYHTPIIIPQMRNKSNNALIMHVPKPVIHKTLQIDDAPSSTKHFSHSVPALWIFGPAKTSTTSIYTALEDSFPNWHHPEPNKPFREYIQIWTQFLTENYFGSDKKSHYYKILTEYLDAVVLNKSIESLDQYPFHDILLLLRPYIIERQLSKQRSVFSNIINASKHDEDMMVIVKTPAHYYSPFIPIIFAYHLSPTNYIQNQHGTKVLILLRNSVQRTISWYSLFYIQKFEEAFIHDEEAIFELIRHQINAAISYKPLENMRDMIVNRNTEHDDIIILNEYFKFFYGFSRLFKKCNAVELDRKMQKECKDIDVVLFDERWNYTSIRYKYINNVRHPIHMLFVGLSYPHLLLPLLVFKQQEMLGTKFRFMLFDFIIHQPKEALYLMTCWSQNTACDTGEFKRNHGDIWENINLPHQKHASLAVPNDVKTLLTRYYAPVTRQINDMLNRFNAKDEIFLGDWDPEHW